jgi:hypothetical protein
MKVYLVVGFMEEEGVYYVASNYKRAWNWIKRKQKEDMIKDLIWANEDKRRKPNDYLRQKYEDPEQLHPYDIDEHEVDSVK